MIIGIGSDICDATRIASTLEEFGERFITRVFTPAERRRCEARPLVRANSYAKRFAAKEACSKALGTGLRGVGWRDMEVINLPSGQPTMALTGRAAARLARILPPGHQARLHVSLTDDGPIAFAVVVLEALPANGEAQPAQQAQSVQKAEQP